MFIRESKPNVVWSPDDENAAIKAISLCELTELSEKDYKNTIELPAIDDGCAERIREIYNLLKNPMFHISTETGTVGASGSVSETVTIEAKSAYEIDNGTSVENASIVDIDEEVTLKVGKNEFIVQLTNGAGSVDIVTPEQAGSVINLSIQDKESNTEPVIVE